MKESYSHKNALYKELASIPNVKEDSGRKKTKVLSHMPPLPRFADVHTSDLICRPVKSQLSRQRQGQDTELELEKRINVNVLKRCECCRRLAFRYKEMSEKMQNLEKQEKEEEEKKQKKESRETKSARLEETTNAEMQKLIEEAREASPFRQALEKPEGGSEKTRLFQYSSRKPSEAKPIAVNQRVEASFKSLRRQSHAVPSQQQITAQPRSLTTVPSPTRSERVGTRERSWSILFDKCSFTVPPEPSPSPLGRQKIRVKFEHPQLKEKLKVSGRDWSNHILKLQGGRVEGEKRTVATLSKAYLAFKKLLNKMEEERKREEEMAERSEDSEGSSYGTDSPIPRNRLQSEASIVALSRWQPSRRTSRLNSLISPKPPAQNLDQINVEDNNQKNSRIVGLKEDYNDGLSDCTSEGRFTVLQ